MGPRRSGPEVHALESSSKVLFGVGIGETGREGLDRGRRCCRHCDSAGKPVWAVPNMRSVRMAVRVPPHVLSMSPYANAAARLIVRFAGTI